MNEERELLKKALDFMLDAGANLNPLFKEINDNLLAQPEQEPLIFKDRESTGSLIVHDAMYKKGYARGFAIARKDYKQKVINAFGSEDE